MGERKIVRVCGNIFCGREVSEGQAFCERCAEYRERAGEVQDRIGQWLDEPSGYYLVPWSEVLPGMAVRLVILVTVAIVLGLLVTTP